jgi:hypothetical protein
VELLVAGGVLGLLGFLDVRAGATALALLVVTVPRRLGVLRRRRRRAEACDADLFAEWARDVRRSFAGQVLVLALGLPAVVALGLYWFAVPETRIPLFLGGALVVYLPYHGLVRLRATTREWAEVERWRRLGLASDPDRAPVAEDAPRPTSGPRAAWVRWRPWIHLTVAVAAQLLILARLVELLFDPGYHVPSTLLTAVVGPYLLLLLPSGDEDEDEPDRARPNAEPPTEEGDDEEGEADENEDEDDDFTWGGLLLQLLALGLLFLGPPLVLLLLVSALLIDDPRRPLWIAGGVALAWTVQWKFFLPDGDEDEVEHEHEQADDDGPEARP